jgi:hypothetical protein
MDLGENKRRFNMTFPIIKFIVSWVCFLLFADKKKFYCFSSTVYLAVILALITDLLMFVTPLWEYPGSKTQLFYKQMINSFGIYFVTTYFFLQTLPKKQTFLTITRLIFYWSLFSIIIEWVSLKLGYIKHGLWWNLGWSYLADWILFFVFYVHHKWINRHIAY